MQSIFDLRRLPLLCFVLRLRCRCRLAFGLCSRKPRTFRGHRRGRRLDRPLFFGGQTRSLRAFLKLKIRGRPLSHALARALDPIFGLRRLLFSRGILRCVGSPLFVALDLREPNSFGNRRVSRPLLGFNLRKPRLLRSRRLGGGLYRLLLFCGDARSLLALFKFKVRCRQLRLALARVLQPIFDLRRLSLLRRFLRRSRLPVGFDLRKPRSFRRRRFGGGLYRLLLFCGEACGLLALFKFKIRRRQMRGVLARVLQTTFAQPTLVPQPPLQPVSPFAFLQRRVRPPRAFQVQSPRSSIAPRAGARFAADLRAAPPLAPAPLPSPQPFACRLQFSQAALVPQPPLRPASSFAFLQRGVRPPRAFLAPSPRSSAEPYVDARLEVDLRFAPPLAPAPLPSPQPLAYRLRFAQAALVPQPQPRPPPVSPSDFPRRGVRAPCASQDQSPRAPPEPRVDGRPAVDLRFAPPAALAPHSRFLRRPLSPLARRLSQCRDWAPRSHRPKAREQLASGVATSARFGRAALLRPIAAVTRRPNSGAAHLRESDPHSDREWSRKRQTTPIEPARRCGLS